MKVVDVTEFWSERGGGVRSYLTNKAQSLSALGVEHLVMASGSRDEESVLAHGAINSKLQRLSGPSLPYDPTYHLFMRFGEVRRRVTLEVPDVLEIHSPELAAVAALRLPRDAFKVRTMVWHSDFIDTYLASRIASVTSAKVGGLVTEPLWGWVRALAKRCDTTIAASAFQAAKLRSHGVPRVTELRFGVDTSVFSPAARDEAFRQRHMGSRTRPLFVHSARLAGEKRGWVVVEAFRRFRAQRDGVLLIYGDGPERARLEARARDIPDVHFMGFEKDRSELSRAIASADAMLHASPFETFGLAVAEAVACGTPVVVADLGAAHELAVPGCSETYPADDPAALAAAAERLLLRDPSELRARARDAVSQVVSIDLHFRRLVALYSDLLKQRNGVAAA